MLWEQNAQFFKSERTPEQRERELKYQQKQMTNKLLSRDFLDSIRSMLYSSDLETGIVGEGIGCVELLAKKDGVVYKITVRVDSEDYCHLDD